MNILHPLLTCVSVVTAGLLAAANASAQPQQRLSLDFDQQQAMKAKGATAILDPRTPLVDARGKDFMDPSSDRSVKKYEEHGFH